MLVLGVILFTLVFVCGSLAHWLLRWVRGVRYFLVFTGAYLLSMSFIALIPDLFTAPHTSAYIGIGLMGGFLLQYYLEQLTGGIEHGHTLAASWGSRGLGAIFVGLCLHAFIEGGVLAYDGVTYAILYAIVLHKMPASVAFVVAMRAAKLSVRVRYIALGCFALASPLGLWLGLYTVNYVSLTQVQWLFAVVVGILLHIATRMLLEGTPQHRYDLRINVTILLGIALTVVQHIW